MKSILTTLALCLMLISASAQEEPNEEIKGVCGMMEPIPTLSISANPAGYLFFGPTLDISYAINNTSLAITAGVRQTNGLIVKKRKQKTEEFNQLNGSGFSLGLIHFSNNFGSGLYFGGQLGYDKLHVDYSEGQPWEWYEDAKTYHVGGNIGVRSFLSPRFYVNTGLFFGGMISNYDWDYTDLSYGLIDPEARSGTKFYPNGMLEIAIGYVILH